MKSGEKARPAGKRLLVINVLFVEGDEAHTVCYMGGLEYLGHGGDFDVTLRDCLMH